MVATKSPDGVISYIEEKYDLTIDEWIAAIQYELCRKQKLPQSKLKAGSFAYDNLATLVYELLNHVHLRTFILQHQVQPMCEALHQTWCKHYCSWRDQTPWTKHPSYIKPAQALGDERRNKLCTTKFQQLPPEENIKYQTIVNVIYERLQPVMVEENAVVEQEPEQEEQMQEDAVDEEENTVVEPYEQEADEPEPEMQEENAVQQPEDEPEHVEDAEQQNEVQDDDVDTRMQDESVDDMNADNDNIDKDTDNTCVQMQTTQPDEEEEQQQEEAQITLSTNQLALGPPTFEPAQLQVINMLILKLSKDLTIPEKELRVLATEHWGQNFESLGFVIKEVKRKPSASKQTSQSSDSSSSTGCTYRYRKNHKTKGGQVCNQPCVKNATLCYEHNRKKILASKD